MFVHNEQDDDYSSFAPTQLADDELRVDAGLDRRLQPLRREGAASAAGAGVSVVAAEPLESTLPRQAGPRRIESGAMRTSSTGALSTASLVVAALLVVGVGVLLLIAH